MFFLLRLAFWLTLVLVLLPREKTPESEKLPQVDASQAVQAATSAVKVVKSAPVVGGIRSDVAN